jgi:PKD repeat protein
MKRILAILPLLSLLVISCNREPIADATVDRNPAYVGDIIRFTSYSTNTDYVEWDMDDGIMYTDPVVDHYYIDPGFYDVTLRAFGTKGGVSTAVIPMEVLGAELTVRVREWSEIPGEGYLVPNVSVILYPTLADWDNQTNAVSQIVEGTEVFELYTNSYGDCTFENLSYQIYYADVWGPNHDNWTLRDENPDWVTTPLMDDDYIWEAIVDYYPNGKKSALTGKRPQKALKSAPAGEKRTPTIVISKVPRER